MADSTTGFDPSQLQGLLAMFQPSDQDKQNARTAALAAAGFGILGARGVNGMQAIGQGGAEGMQAYTQNLKDVQAQRLQNLQAGMSLTGLLRQNNIAKAMQNIATGGDQSQGQPAQAPAQPVAGQAPTTAALFGPTAPQTPGGMNSDLPPAPLTTPPPTPAQPAFTPPDWHTLAPKAAIAMALASQDPKQLGDLAVKYSSTQMGPDGTVMNARGMPLYKQSDAGMQLFNPDGSPGQFLPVGAGNTQATAQRAAATAGATTSATEQAKLPTTFTTLNLPNGGTQQVTGQQLQDILQGRGPTAGQPLGGIPQGALGQTPSPAAQAADTAQATDTAKGFAKTYQDAVSAEMQAPRDIAQLKQLSSYLSNVQTGAAAPSVIKLKQYVGSMFPDLTKNWTAQVPYAEAANALRATMAKQLRDPSAIGARVGENDQAFLESLLAGPENDPRAIPMMTNAAIALKQRDMAIGKLARNYNGGKLDNGFYQTVQDFAANNPMFDAGGAAAPKSNLPAPGTVSKDGRYIMGANGKVMLNTTSMAAQ